MTSVTCRGQHLAPSARIASGRSGIDAGLVHVDAPAGLDRVHECQRTVLGHCLLDRPARARLDDSEPSTPTTMVPALMLSMVLMRSLLRGDGRPAGLSSLQRPPAAPGGQGSTVQCGTNGPDPARPGRGGSGDNQNLQEVPVAESRELNARECEALLRSGVAGRIAVSTPTGPHIVPVNYTVVDDAIIVRTSPYSLLGTYGRDAMLAFEIDGFDRFRHRGWSVQARGGRGGDRPGRDRQDQGGRRAPALGRRPRSLYLRLRWTELSGRKLGADWDPMQDLPCGCGRLKAVPHTVQREPHEGRRLGGAAEALLEAVTAISSDLDLRSVLTRIVEAATQLTECEVRRPRRHRRRRVAGGVRDDGDRRGAAPPDR